MKMIIFILKKKIINISSFIAHKKEYKWRNQYRVGKNECNICYEKKRDFSNVNNALLYPVKNVLLE